MSKVLIIRGAGFVGSNLVRRAPAEDAARVVYNLLSAERWPAPDDRHADPLATA